MNLFLFIRKIQLYYGDDFCRKNDTYFRTANYFLGKNGLSNVYENGIIDLVNKNCNYILNSIFDEDKKNNSQKLIPLVGIAQIFGHLATENILEIDDEQLK